MGTSASQTTGIMVTKILAILGLTLIGNCYAQWVTLSGYGGHSNPTWDYKPNVGEKSMRSVIDPFKIRSSYQLAKRSAADENPDFDHFLATRGKRSEDPDFDHFSATRGKRSEDERATDPDFDHFFETRGKRSDVNPDFDHFSATRGKRSPFYQYAKPSILSGVDPDFNHFLGTRGKGSAADANLYLDHLLATRWYLGSF